jgi:hypothetical protein
MKTFYQEHKDVAWQSYAIYPLLLSDAPEFEIKTEYRHISNYILDCDELFDKDLPQFNLLLCEFYHKSNVKVLWYKYKPVYDSICNLSLAKLGKSEP